MAKPTSIQWLSDPQLSVIHATYVVATDARCIDPKLQHALVGPATELNERLLSASVDVAAFWQRLMAECLFDPSNKNTTELALVQAGCNELQLEQIAGAVGNCLSDCRLAFQKRFPKLVDQLELRIRPLKDRWETIGPGLLLNLSKQIWGQDAPSDWWPSKITAVAVQPIRGGDGDYDPDAERLWIEANLTDIDPNVPELLRLVWLILNMAVDVHTRGKFSSGDSLPWSLAAVPMVLSAAADLNAIPEGSLPITQALRLWRLGDDSIASKLDQWYQEWQSTKTQLPIALKALQRSIQPSSSDTTDVRSAVDAD